MKVPAPAGLSAIVPWDIFIVLSLIEAGPPCAFTPNSSVGQAKAQIA